MNVKQEFPGFYVVSGMESSEFPKHRSVQRIAEIEQASVTPAQQSTGAMKKSRLRSRIRRQYAPVK